MTTSENSAMREDHPLVVAYLRRFDTAALRLPEGRRAQLRGEVADHLREVTSADMPDADVRRVLDDLGDPAVIVGEEAAEPVPITRRAWIVGGALLLLSVVVGYLQQWGTPLPIGVPLSQIAWAVGVLVFAFATPSVTARRPLGTGALVGLVLWEVVVDLIANLIARTLQSPGDDVTGLIAFDYVRPLGDFVFAAIAVVQIARIEAVPRPWRWAPAWALGIVAGLWVLERVAGLTAGGSAAIAAGIGLLAGLAVTGADLVLGLIAIGLGAGVLRRPA